MAVKQYFETFEILVNFGKGNKDWWFQTPPLCKPAPLCATQENDENEIHH